MSTVHDSSNRKRKRKDKHSNSKAVNETKAAKRTKLEHDPENANSIAKKPKSDSNNPAEDSKRRKRKRAKNRLSENTSELHAAGLDFDSTQNAATTAGAQDLSEITSSQPQDDRQRFAWKLSHPEAGRLIDLDPIISSDESCILLASENAALLYSTSTSLLQHAMSSPDAGPLTSYCFSAIAPNSLYTATAQGQISHWNWSKAEQLAHWSLSQPISFITTALFDQANQDTIFALHYNNQSSSIRAYHFGTDKNFPPITQAVLLTFDKHISTMKVLDAGRIIVAITNDSLLLGRLSKDASGSLSSLKYSWRDIKCHESPTCFDVRLSTDLAVQKGSSKRSAKLKARSNALHVVIGGLKGSIFIFDDILTKVGMENHSADASLLSINDFAARQLHWHREAVGAVAWSLDGNYLISGGQETVLILWQLDTGIKQYLPNLESPIQGLTLSPSGSSYAIRLGDNSVMILSTDELKPTANIVGLQISSQSSVVRYGPPVLPTHELHSTIDQISLHGLSAQLVPSVINSHSKLQILAAVPAYQNRGQSVWTNVPRPYLQTFDLATMRHITRQPLVRTNDTNVNLGPDGNRIREPDIKLMGISHDGRWLATIDEWMPHREDLEDLIYDDQDARDESPKLREVHLNFWHRIELDDRWELNSRIDAPHMQDNTRRSSRVLDLASDPGTTSFSTIGEDGVVRIWAPSHKRSDGKVVQGEGSSGIEGEAWWAAKHTILLEKRLLEDPLESLSPCRARLAYSSDGSVIASHQYFPSEDYENNNFSNDVHFIDSDSGSIRNTQQGLYSGEDGIHNLGFLDHFLICVGMTSATVWDVTSFELIASIKLSTDTEHDQSSLKQCPPLLAINTATSTFAVVLTVLPVHGLSKIEKLWRRQDTPEHSKVSIFNPYSSMPDKPQYSTTIPALALNLLSTSSSLESAHSNEDLAGTSRDYIFIDSSGSVRVLKPSTGNLPRVHTQTNGGQQDISTRLVDEASTDENEATRQYDEDLSFSSGEIVSKANFVEPLVTGIVDTTQSVSEGTVVIRPEQVAALFDSPSHTLPDIRSMFDDVVKLFSPCK